MRVTLFVPTIGRRWTVGAEALVGRSASREIHIEDPRLSSIHAEVCERDEGLVLISRGIQPLRVGGRIASQVTLTTGLSIELAPGLEVHVERVFAGGTLAPGVATAGRSSLRIEVGDRLVTVWWTGGEVTVTDTPGSLLAALLRAPLHRAPWFRLAEAVWPEEGERLRRRWEDQPTGVEVDYWNRAANGGFRNKFDKTFGRAREQTANVREGGLASMAGGEARAHVHPGDRCVHRVNVRVWAHPGEARVSRVAAALMDVASDVSTERTIDVHATGILWAPGKAAIAAWLGQELARLLAPEGPEIPLREERQGLPAEVVIALEPA